MESCDDDRAVWQLPRGFVGTQKDLVLVVVVNASTTTTNNNNVAMNVDMDEWTIL